MDSIIHQAGRPTKENKEAELSSLTTSHNDSSRMSHDDSSRKNPSSRSSRGGSAGAGGRGGFLRALLCCFTGNNAGNDYVQPNQPDDIPDNYDSGDGDRPLIPAPLINKEPTPIVSLYIYGVIMTSSS